MDGDDKFAISMVIISCVTVLGLTCLLVSCGNEINSAIEDTNAAIDASRKTAQDVSPAIEHANGCPLDAIAYDAPAFADHDSNALKVIDRFNKSEWWLVRIGGEWIVLPTSKEVSK